VSGAGRARLAGALGVAWGTALFVYPDAVWERVAGRRCTDDEQLVTQLLGARHVVQGLAEVVAPRVARGPARSLAAWRREYAPPALAFAAVAVAGAALAGGGGRRR
jgi:hypothetical protein